MKTLTNKPLTKKLVKPAAKKVAPWVGSARDLITLKPGVDLTQPTLPPGRHL